MHVGKPIFRPLFWPLITLPSTLQLRFNSLFTSSILPFFIFFLINVEEIILFFILKGLVIKFLKLYCFSYFFKVSILPLRLNPNLKFLLTYKNLQRVFLKIIFLINSSANKDEKFLLNLIIIKKSNLNFLSWAFFFSSLITFWCPKCIPSKFPIAITPLRCLTF